MRKKNKIFNWLPLILMAITVYPSCKEDKVMYDTGQKSHILITGNDTTITRIYSLVFELSDQESFLYEIPVSIMGTLPSEDAEFEVELLRDTISEWIIGDSERKLILGEEGVDFELGRLVIAKGQTTGIIPVKVYRKDYMTDNYVSILLAIKENDNFQPINADCFRLLVADGDPVCPQWWADMSASYLPGWCYLLGWFSPDKYRMLLTLYWETEEKNPVFYYEVFDKYGRYLSDTYIDEDGQTQQTELQFFRYEKPAIWAALILQPLCEYYKKYYASLPPGSQIEDIRLTLGTPGEYWLDPVFLL